MVNTRALTMNSVKGKRNQNKKSNRSRANNSDSGNEKSKMKSDSKSSSICSNPESEEDDQNVPTAASNPPGLAGSSIKVTLKKTRSCSSSSSRESTQSFEVVRRLTTTTESVSGEEDCENPKDSGQEKPSEKSPSVDAGENEKESEGESQNANSSDDSDVEILSDDSDKSSTERPSPAVLVKAEEKNVSINTVVDLKTEELPQNSTVVKKEECKIQIKPLKEELLKEPNIETDLNVLKTDNETKNTQVPQPQNNIEKNEIKDQVKEQKFKLNVRSFDDLVDPRTAILINMPPPAQIDRAPNFLTQNGGGPFPLLYLACDVCGIQYDSPELLNDHKIASKHFKCSFKECEHLVELSQQEFLEHQRMVHNGIPSPVQQLAHQVQRLPAMGFDQQLQSGVPPLTENISPMYTPRIPNHQVPMQRTTRQIIRPPLPPNVMPPNVIPPRGGRNIQRVMRPRLNSSLKSADPRNNSLNSTLPKTNPINSTPPRTNTLKRSLTNLKKAGEPASKRTNPDRNSYTTTLNESPPIAKSIAESLTKSAQNSVPVSQRAVVNLFSKRGLTISTVDKGKNLNIPTALSLNKAVTITPSSSPHKVPSNVPNKVSSSVSNMASKHVPPSVPTQSMDTVDLTGPDKPKKYYPCEICSKTYTSAEKLYEHTSIAHKSTSIPFRCNLCKFIGQNSEALSRHKSTVHKTEMNGTSFVIPVVDLNKPSSVNKLRNLGVTSFIPVSQLDNQGGQFGVPIMSFGKKSNLLDGMNATNFFNLGTVRHIQ